LSKIYKDRSDIFPIDVRENSFSFNSIVVSIELTSMDLWLASREFLSSNSNHDFILFILCWQSNCLIDLENELIFFVNSELFCKFNCFLRDWLDATNWFLSLFCNNLHEDASFPETTKLWIFVH